MKQCNPTTRVFATVAITAAVALLSPSAPGAEAFTIDLASQSQFRTSTRTIMPSAASFRRGSSSSSVAFSPLNHNDMDLEEQQQHKSKTSSTALQAIAEPAMDAGVLKRLDREMTKAARQREKLEKELEQVQSKLQIESKKFTEIATRKKQYLDGAKLGVIPAARNFSETAGRSALKAFCWRIIAGSVTFVTALRFSGSVSNALKIVGSDFFSKSFTMFIGERLMNKSKAGRTGGADNMKRSLAKALLWRIFAIANTLTMAVFIAKDITIAYKIAGSDAIVKTAMMFGYERFWAKVEWGKEYEIEFSI